MPNIDDFPDIDDATDAMPKLIGGRFRLMEPIGTGSTATVFRARDAVTGEDVALKLLFDHHSRNQRMRKRFSNEGLQQSQFNHPNIVKLVVTGEDRAGRLYHAFELIDGINLHRCISSGYEFSTIEALDIVLDLLKALAWVHPSGLVHRDLKPHNVLLHPDGRALLSDFGYLRVHADGADQSSFEEELTDLGDVIGEIGYVANEQRGDARNVGPWTDLYSVGALLFHMLANKPPEDLSLAERHPSMFSDLPLLVHDLVHKATAYNHAERYQSALTMAGDVADVRDQVAKAANKPLIGNSWMDEMPAMNVFTLGTPASEKPRRREKVRKTEADLAEEPIDWAVVLAWGVSLFAGALMLGLWLL